jgi:hypothetical protein
MNTALVKPSKVINGMTSIVRAHLNACERAREIYLAQMKRAESDYAERIQRAALIFTGGEEVSGNTAAPEASASVSTNGA